MNEFEAMSEKLNSMGGALRERLREALTSEQRALRAAEYERHAGMVNEALSKGFRKGGNCRRAGGAS